MVKVPTPETAGLNCPLITPVPEYIPPEGEPPVKVTGDALKHIGANGLKVTVVEVVLIIVHVFE